MTLTTPDIGTEVGPEPTPAEPKPIQPENFYNQCSMYFPDEFMGPIDCKLELDMNSK